MSQKKTDETAETAFKAPIDRDADKKY
ncbi:hypothetical protein CLS_19170 [[Clostridium] cf. saccharolyticum K10]|nr:hypothetical protein CLS_19170 [[Clostridium] cf. saccharolyticum K10]